MSAQLAIGLGRTAAHEPLPREIAAVLRWEAGSIRSLQDSREAARARKMVASADDARLYTATLLEIAAEIIGSLTPEEAERLRARARRVEASHV